MSDKIYCKAEDVKNRTVDVETCKSCGKWHVVGRWARYCEWCGEPTGNKQIIEEDDEE